MKYEKLIKVFSDTVLLSCSCIVVGGGESRRMNGTDKLMTEINGVPVFIRTLLAMADSGAFTQIIYVCREDSVPEVDAMLNTYGLDKSVEVCIGGNTRMDSVLNGLALVSKKTRIIAIHDAARPLVSLELIKKAVRGAVKFGACAPALELTSTVKKIDGETIVSTLDRETLRCVQTPQAFQAQLIKAALKNAFENGLKLTDDCGAVEALGLPVHICAGDPANIKITVPDDIELCKYYLKLKGTR